MGIDTIAIVLTEVLAVAIFLLALKFLKQLGRISDRLEIVRESGLEEQPEEECWSYKWTKENITSPRRTILHPGLWGAFFLIIGPGTLAIIAGLVAVIALGAVGYTPLLVLIALDLISDPEAYQAYNYVDEIKEVSMERLVEEDEDYMVTAKKALERKTSRFLLIAVSFAMLGPLIPLILPWLAYTLSRYAILLFRAVEISSRVSLFLAAVIILVGPGLLLYFGEKVGRTLLSMLKEVIRKTHETE